VVCKDEAASAAAASGPIGLDFGCCAEFGEGVIRPLLSGQGQSERMVQARRPDVKAQSLSLAHSLRRQGANTGSRRVRLGCYAVHQTQLSISLRSTTKSIGFAIWLRRIAWLL
jgi:hypothetical protein